MTKLAVDKPFLLTIFGASGDLARIKIFPALYHLFLQKRLPENFWVVGFARTQKSHADFRAEFKAAVKADLGKALDEKVLDRLLEKVYYFVGRYNEIGDFQKYADFTEQFDLRGHATHLAYFSVPSSAYHDILKYLAATKRNPKQDTRLILEKPFGQDKKTAEEIFHYASQKFPAESFYLLDHYLGKPSVRSILHLRESNRILSHMMRGYEIANIQITAFEDVGVKQRAAYFDQVGTVKDMIQSHLLQMLALVTMSLPTSETAKSLQREKYAVLSAIDCPADEKNVVIGQYDGYTKEQGVPAGSKAETFAALRLFIDRLDWNGVPLYIRTGKRLKRKKTYVVVELKKFPFQNANEDPNRLIFELDPDERLSITLVNRQDEISIYQNITASQSIACSIEGCLPPGHPILLLDALRGEKKNFLSFPEILAAWDVVDEVSRLIAKQKVKLEKYADGADGPKSQHKLTAMDGFTWYEV